VVDPGSGEVKKRVELPYPNSSGALATAGGIVVTAMIDGTILAYDDRAAQHPRPGRPHAGTAHSGQCDGGVGVRAVR
jgi:glucose dehydrogenase